MNEVRQEKGTNNSEYTALGKKLQEIQTNFFNTVARAEYLKIPKSKKRGALQDWEEKGPDRKFDPNNIEDVILLKSYIEGINETSAVIPKEIKSGLMARQ